MTKSTLLGASPPRGRGEAAPQNWSSGNTGGCRHLYNQGACGIISGWGGWAACSRSKKGMQASVVGSIGILDAIT